MTESELQVQYQQRVIKGKLACMQRLFKMGEREIDDNIKRLTAQKEVEVEVADKIKSYFTAKNAYLQDTADGVDVKKDTKLRSLSEEKHKIEDDKTEAEREIVIVRQKCEKEYTEKKKQEEIDKDEEEKEKQKVRDKLAQEAAAKYV